jgi:hypothetical protein
MIPYLFLRTSYCVSCSARIDFDARLVKRAVRVCSECKRLGLAAREKARRAAVKERSASVDVKMLERLAVRSYQEVGDLVGLSAESIRKIEQAALDKLAKNFAALRSTVQAHLRPEAESHGFRATVHRGE